METTLLENSPDLMKMQEEDLKKIEEIKAFLSEPNDDNLTNPTEFLSFSA